MDKKILRKKVKQLFQNYSISDLEIKNQKILTELFKQKETLQAHCIGLYAALPDEVQTQAIFDKLIHLNKEVVFPRCISKEDMNFFKVSSWKNLKKNKFSLLEPPIDSTLCDLDQIDLMLIPGRAFDREDHRLGRGAGFYDRTLKNYSGLKIGLCFDFQIFESIPHDEHDVAMDRLISV